MKIRQDGKDMAIKREDKNKKSQPETKTMRRDLARLRLLEAEEERVRIIDLQKKEKLRKKEEEKEVEETEEIKKIKGAQEVQEEIERFEQKKKEPFARFVEKISQERESSGEILSSLSQKQESRQKKETGERTREEQESTRETEIEPKAEPRPKFEPRPEFKPESKSQSKPQPQPKPVSKPKEKDVLSLLKEKGLKQQIAALLKKEEKIKNIISSITGQEKAIERKIKNIEEQEEKIDLPEKLQEIEKERWRLEKERQAIERKRQEQERRLQEIKTRIKKIDLKLSQPKLRKMEGLGFSDKITEKGSEETRDNLDKVKLNENTRETREKLGILETEEEIRKDNITRFKEPAEDLEALEKRWEEGPAFLSKSKRIFKEFDKPARISEEYPEKPTPKERLYIRIIIVVLATLVLAGVTAFLYWFLIVKPSSRKQSQETPQQQVLEPNEKPEEPTISPSLIPISKESIVEISHLQELFTILKNFIRNDFEKDKLIRVLIKDNSQNQFLDFSSFIQGLGMKSPDGLIQMIENDFTFFLYPNQDQNQIGFVTRIERGKQEDVLSAINRWEETMTQDWKNLFLILGGDNLYSARAFQSAEHHGTVFRYSSFPSHSNLGICWTAFDNYFVFTSSGELMLRVIELLKSSETQSDSKELVWNVFEKISEAIDNRDINKVNESVYKKFSIEECAQWNLSEQECWEMIDLLLNEINEFGKSDFVNIEEDENQIIISTNSVLENETQSYSRAYLYFIKNAQGEILLLRATKMSWEKEIMAKDTDRDGLTDEDEVCAGAAQYDPDCIPTNPQLKDTDKDGWWDSIELEARTNPNDPEDHPYS